MAPAFRLDSTSSKLDISPPAIRGILLSSTIFFITAGMIPGKISKQWGLFFFIDSRTYSKLSLSGINILLMVKTPMSLLNFTRFSLEVIIPSRVMKGLLYKTLKL